ncbi:MAG: acyltransferase [Cyclobacteriaceae bacterium]|nr:acyltransferase [Cyclobacteriaceae bacterium]
MDGLRFLCFLSVFFYHSFHTNFGDIKSSGLYRFLKWEIFGNGNLGVNFFFVLSGFLITYLLIQEKKLNGQIALKKFWIRRILRIWPLFFFCVIFGFYLFPLLKSFFGQVPNETASIGYYLTFLNNFDMMNKGLPDSSVLGVLWSIAIEEQFYLIWPVILYLLPIKNYWIAFVSIILSSLIFRAVFESPSFHEIHTLSCIGDMAMGAFGAWLISEKPTIKEKIINLKSGYILLLYLVSLGIFLFRDEILYSNYYIRIFERSIIAFVFLLIILEQNYAKNSLIKLSKFKTLTKLGIISYGLYCLHFIGILITTTLTDLVGLNTKIGHVLILETGLALTITIIIAFISYRFYETPFLKLKKRFSFITKE